MPGCWSARRGNESAGTPLSSPIGCGRIPLPKAGKIWWEETREDVGGILPAVASPEDGDSWLPLSQDVQQANMACLSPKKDRRTWGCQRIWPLAMLDKLLFSGNFSLNVLEVANASVLRGELLLALEALYLWVCPRLNDHD